MTESLAHAHKKALAYSTKLLSDPLKKVSDKQIMLARCRIGATDESLDPEIRTLWWQALQLVRDRRWYQARALLVQIENEKAALAARRAKH
jgi:hypothetical protein